MKDFLFVDLSMGDTKVIDGMAAGTFTDMWGRGVEFKAEELPAYVANTKRALESTRDSNGQIVGFPIDAMNHEMGAAAAWIVDLHMAEDMRSVIQFDVRWNAKGAESVGGDTMRYFSPTVDTEQKVIVGGSLTNWPASRTPDYQHLLKPIELSAQINTFDAPPIVTLGDMLRQGFADLKNLLSGRGRSTEPDNLEVSEETMPDPTPTPETTHLVVDLSSPEALQAIEARAVALAETKTAALLAEREHAAAVAQLTSRLVGGTPEKPSGLPVDAARLSAFLSSLSAEQFAEANVILSAAAEREPLDFAEHGTAAVVQGTKPLPDTIKPSLVAWLKAKRSLEEFFKVNAVELGSQTDYNLTEFLKE